MNKIYLFPKHIRPEYLSSGCNLIAALITSIISLMDYLFSYFRPTRSLDDIYTNYRNSSDSQYASRSQLATIASFWGLKLVAYESGPGWSVGETTGVGQWILAQRFAPMRDVVKYDVETSWLPAGGDVYNCFSLSGDYSRYGIWGFSEWHQNITTPRYCLVSSS